MHTDAPRQGDALWIDWTNASVWRDGAPRRLTPKACAVLRVLTAHTGHLVSKTVLLDTVWPEAVVGEAVLTECIRELRQAFGETARAPRWIQTVHRRGYRFAGPVPGPAFHAGGGHPTDWQPPEGLSLPLSSPGASAMAPFVGREAELTHLHARLAAAQGGTRQVVFITGEPGLGKTRLVQAFAAQVAAMGGVGIAPGQCFAHYGVGEAYLPVLEALSRLCRAPGGAAFLVVLEQQAPTWLAQLPAFLSPAALEAVQRRILGTTHTRMLRELVMALDTFSRASPLVLLLEDLHWSDAATLALLSALARRPEPARLLVLGTYRPGDVLVRQHPLQALTQDLAIHHQCTTLPLALLTAAEVAQYLGTRFDAVHPPSAALQALAQTLYGRTDGNPLFLVTLVDELVRQGRFRAEGAQWASDVEGIHAAVALPESLRQMILQQCAALPLPDQEVLEAASVAGAEHCAATIAAGLEVAVEVVEARCASLVRRGQFLSVGGLEQWPDGTVTEYYRWRHALYQEVLYARVPAGHRVRLHRRMGTRLETGYGAQVGTRAAVLADHFVRGLDTPRALQYLQLAAQNALQRHGYQEAIVHLTRGLDLLRTLPDTPARSQHVLTLLLALGAALQVTKGLAAPEVEDAYSQARALCQQVGQTPQLIPVLFGLWRFYVTRAQFHIAREMGATLLRLAQRADDAALAVIAHYACGWTAFCLGTLPAARAHLEEAIVRYHPDQRRALVFHMGQDPGVACRVNAAEVLWLLGYPAQALARLHEALALAHTLAHPYSLALAWCHAAILAQWRRDMVAVVVHAEATVTLATEQGFPFWAACGTSVWWWALARQGQGEAGLAQVRQGLAAWRATGSTLAIPYLCTLLAEAATHLGHPAVSLHALAEAHTLVQQQEERWWEAEIARLRGVLLLRQPGASQAEAEAWLRRALDVARRQGAKSLELRAAMSLACLWQQQGKQAEARELLAPIYGWFTEGFDTADLQEAKVLLDELGG